MTPTSSTSHAGFPSREGKSAWQRCTVVCLVLLVAACGAPAALPQGGGSATAGAGSPAPPASAAQGGGHWTPLPTAPLTPRHDATGLWVDGAFLVVGGRSSEPCPPGADCVTPAEPALTDGARFDPQEQAWTPIAPAPAPLTWAVTTVLDSTAFLWLADYGPDGEPRATFLSYDAARDVWTQRPLPRKIPSGVGLTTAGEAVISFVNSHEQGREPDWLFDPASEQWEPLPRDPLGPSFDRQMIGVGDQVVLLAQDLVDSPGASAPSLVRAAVLDLATGTWRLLPDSEVAGGWGPWFLAGDQVINPTPGGANGGETNNWGRTYPFGGILDLADERWLPLPQPHPGDEGRSGVRVPAAGDADVVVSVTGHAYVPATQAWTTLTLPREAGEEAQAGAVGDGRYYLWGGVRWSDEGDLIGDGWVWTPMAG